MLSDRQRRILSALIEEYVAHAMPVGSRTIAEQYHLGVSPATIRNELAALEDAGYITQPHTSAGRIPTDAGYRKFVDGILEQQRGSGEQPNTSAMEELRASADALDNLMERISAELARFTRCMSVVVPPAHATSQIRQISLIALSDVSVMVVVVCVDGLVLNGQLITKYPIDMQFLSTLQTRISELFAARPILQASSLCESILNDPLAAGEVFTSLFAQDVVECISRTLAQAGTQKPASMGMSALMTYPEFRDSAALAPVLELLEDGTVLLKTVDEAGASGDVSVCIGAENPSVSLRGVSVIAGMYGDAGERGVVAVIGPTRMNYSRVISAVRAAQSMLVQP